MNLTDKTVLFLGDSITEGVGTTCEEKRYYNVLKDKYGLKEAVGYGVSGTRFAIQHKPSSSPNFDRFFSMRADDMQDSADIIVVFGGTNDYGNGDAPIGIFDDRTPHTFYGACHELFEKLITKYPDSVIVIVTPLHRVNEMNLRGSGRKEDEVAPLYVYVDIIKEVARYYSLPVCDLYANSGMQPNIQAIRETYIPDGLHPNDRGNKVIAERLGEFLKSL